MKSHVLEKESPFLTAIREEGKNLPEVPVRWRRLRRDSLDRFLDLGLPGPAEEAWRFTSVKSLSKLPVSSDSRVAPSEKAVQAAVQASLVERASMRLVFVNGRLHTGLSSPPRGGKGLEAESLADALARAEEESTKALGGASRPEQHRFGALNTAFFRDGAWIRVRAGERRDEPVHLLFLSIPTGTAPLIVYPRVGIRVEREAAATILEEHVSLGESVLFSNGVTEVWVEEGGVLDHYTLQRENEKAFHLGTLGARVGRNGRFSTHSISLGGKWARNDVDVFLEGEGAACDLTGLYLTRGRQHVDHHTFMDHVSPRTTSREFYKGVLDEKSTAVFNGRVLIRPDSQKTDTAQTNNNLLLSPHAQVNTNPQLEIFADDVQARHGATVSQLEDEHLFYLRSRGIPEEESRRILIHGFIGEILDRIEVEPLRKSLSGMVEERF